MNKKSAPSAADMSSVEEVAHQLGVHPALVYREIRCGRLTAYRIGRRVLRVSQHDLAIYLRTQLSGTDET